MIGNKKLLDAIELVIWSGLIKDEKPLSLMIVASAESGKTQALMKYNINDGIAYMTDCTAFGLQRDIIPLVEKGEIKHIMIPDLLKPLSRKQSTVNTFVTFLNALIEEGIADILTYVSQPTRKIKGLKCGLITSITADELKDQRHRWVSMGFLSRCLPFSYSYSQKTVKEIFDYIMSEKYQEESKIKLKLPKKPKDIKISKRFAEKVKPFSYAFAEPNKVYGFRFQTQLQVLMKANALRNKRKAVNNKDYKKVEDLMNHLNLNYKAL